MSESGLAPALRTDPSRLPGNIHLRTSLPWRRCTNPPERLAAVSWRLLRRCVAGYHATKHNFSHHQGVPLRHSSWWSTPTTQRLFRHPTTSSPALCCRMAAHDGARLDALLRGYSMGSTSMSCYALGAEGLSCTKVAGAARFPAGVPADHPLNPIRTPRLGLHWVSQG